MCRCVLLQTAEYITVNLNSNCFSTQIHEHNYHKHKLLNELFWFILCSFQMSMTLFTDTVDTISRFGIMLLEIFDVKLL